MKLVGVTAYGICIRNEANQNMELHDIYGVSFLEYLFNVTNDIVKEYHNDKALENVFAYDIVNWQTIRNVVGQKVYDILYFRVKTGEYGEESEIVNSETGTKTHTKKANEADVMPFGGCVIVPSGQYTEGIILLQSLGRNGITSVIKKKFNQYIKGIDKQLRVVFNPIIPGIYMERILENCELKKIRMISYGISDDDADKFGIDRGTTKIVQERVLRSPKGFVRNKLDRIIQCLRGEITYDAIIQLDDFEINDLKFEFSMGRRSKTISMKGLDQLVINEDVTNDVIIENGHPTFNSLCRVMNEIGEEYLRTRGFID